MTRTTYLQIGAVTGLGLGLVAGCDALWHSQLTTDPGVCTQSSSLCPSGQVCDFSAGICQPIGGTNPPGWSVSSPSVSSCPQAPTITITGPVSSHAPAIKLNTLDVDPSDVQLPGDGTLKVKLPRQLGAGPVTVTLSYGGGQTPVILNPGFQYSTQAPVAGTGASAPVTALVAIDYRFSQLPTPLTQVAAWTAQRDALDLAVLGGSNNLLAHYRDTTVATRQAPSFPLVSTVSALNGGLLLQTGNLATAGDGSSAGTQALLTATQEAGSVAYFLGGADVPGIKTPGSLQPKYPVLRQLVAGGFFRDGYGSPQALTFIGWQSGTGALPIEINAAPNQITTAGTNFATITTALQNPLPLALATGMINNDASTDVVLLLGTSTNPGAANALYSINGGSSPMPTQFPNLPTAITTVALGSLDHDQLPDLVLGANPGAGQTGKIAVYVNQSAKTAPMISWDTSSPVLIPVTSPPTALTVADYNGDGVNDIIYVAANGVHVLLNQLDPAGRPQFMDYQVYTQPPTDGWGVGSVVAVDFSGDSRPDLILADEKNSTVRLLENSCTPLSG